jgi:hypothetical protein
MSWAWFDPTAAAAQQQSGGTGPITVALGTATETDTAVPLARRVTVGVATETDTVPTGAVDSATESELFLTGNDADTIGTTYGIFDDGLDTATGRWEVDTARAAEGTRSGRIVLATSDASYRRITVSGGDQTIIQIRWYGYMVSTSVTGGDIHICRALRAGGAVVARASVDASQVLSIDDGTTGGSTGDVDYDTASGGLFGKWIRYEWEIDTVANTQELNLFVDSNMHGTTPDHTITHTMTDAVGVGQVEVGSVVAVGEPWDMNYDGIGYLAGTTPIGPISGSPPLTRIKVRALGTATETDTAVAVTAIFGGADTIAVGTATETDTATGVGRVKTVALGTATETDTVTGLGRAKTLAVGAATETDAATGLGRIKTRTVGAATETDAAVGLNRRLNLGTTTETDTAVGVTADKVRAVGTTTETNTATGLASRKTKALGVATETDTAVGVGAPRIRAVGAAAETDTATGVASRKTKALGTATETDAATGVAADKFRAVGAATETDTATGLGRLKTTALGVAAETDTAVAIAIGGDTLNPAFETDTAVGLTARKTKALGAATETDTATGPTRVRSKTVGAATETDTPTGLGRRKSKTLGVAAETDTATGLARLKSKTVGAATEAEVAVAVGRRKTKTAGAATETGTATGVTRLHTRTLGLATEVGTPENLARVKRQGVGFATEIDTAGAITIPGEIVIALGLATETDTAGSVVQGVVAHEWRFIPPPSPHQIRYPVGGKPAGRLFPRISSPPVHYAVLIFDADTTPRVIKTVRPTTRQTDEADYVYLGPREYALSNAESAILRSAGYDVTDELNP